MGSMSTPLLPSTADRPGLGAKVGSPDPPDVQPGERRRRRRRRAGTGRDAWPPVCLANLWAGPPAYPRRCDHHQRPDRRTPASCCGDAARRRRGPGLGRTRRSARRRRADRALRRPVQRRAAGRARSFEPLPRAAGRAAGVGRGRAVAAGRPRRRAAVQRPRHPRRLDGRAGRRRACSPLLRRPAGTSSAPARAPLGAAARDRAHRPAGAGARRRRHRPPDRRGRATSSTPRRRWWPARPATACAPSTSCPTLLPQHDVVAVAAAAAPRRPSGSSTPRSSPRCPTARCWSTSPAAASSTPTRCWPSSRRPAARVPRRHRPRAAAGRAPAVGRAEPAADPARRRRHRGLGAARVRAGARAGRAACRPARQLENRVDRRVLTVAGAAGQRRRRCGGGLGPGSGSSGSRPSLARDTSGRFATRTHGSRTDPSASTA